MQNVHALMEGQRIELEDRRNCTFNRFLIRKSENDDSDDSSCYVSEVSHNYSFRFTRPRWSNDRNQDKVNIKQLELPLILSNVKNPAKRKPLKRRYNKLGLKPLKLLTVQPNTHDPSKSKQTEQKNVPDVICNDEFEECNQEYEEYQLEDSNRVNQVNYDLNDRDVDVDFDFDVLRLIMNEECNNHSPGDYPDLNPKVSNCVCRYCSGAKAHIVDGGGADKSRKIRFTLSKPQSPRTVQVIRVDVTSTQRQDGRHSQRQRQQQRKDDDADDESEYCARFRRAYGLEHDDCNHSRLAKDAIDVNFALMCKKLTLSPKE